MTITLLHPDAVLGPIGPGTYLNAHSDQLQAPTQTWYWLYFIWDTSATTIYTGYSRPSINGELRTWIGVDEPIGAPLGPGRGSLGENQVCTLNLNLYNAQGVQVDFLQIQCHFWTNTGELWKMINEDFSRLPVAGGFTAADRALLQNIYQNDSKFPYSATAQHPPQSGNVTIFLQTGTIAVAYSVVNFPPSPPQSSGEPVYYYNLGFITPRIGNTSYKSTRISFANGFLVLPPTTTNLGVTLLGGTSIILTEYAQGPLPAS